MEVVALGEVLIDFTVLTLNEAGYPTLQANPGGAPANFLCAAAAFGCTAGIVAKVGDDAFGRALLQTLQSGGIETAYAVKDPACFTTLTFVTLDPETGERSFDFARKPGADTQLSPAEVPMHAIEQAKVFHFGTLSLTDEPAAAATKAAVACAKRAGRLLSFDPNLRLPLWKDSQTARNAIRWGLEQADVVKISEEEIDFLYHTSAEQGIELLAEQYGTELILATMGARGCCYRTQTVSGFCPAFSVQPVDTTGAGDIFGGTALALLLRTQTAPKDLSEKQLHRIVRTASAAAALSTLRHGGIASVRPEAEVMAFLKNNGLAEE